MAAPILSTRVATFTGALLLCACAIGPLAHASGGAGRPLPRATATAQAGAAATLHVSLTPDRPGAATTIHFGFGIAASEGGLPPALTELTVHLPAGIGIDTAGVAACSPTALRAHGVGGCPADAQVGEGSVEVKVPLGEQVRLERAKLTVFHGPSQDGRTTLLFFAVGRLPIATRLVFTGVIDPSASGASIQASIPLVPTLPDSPDAAIVSMSSSLGTLGRAYYRSTGGRRVRFTPRGVTLPSECPSGGLAFSAAFGFDEGPGASARTAVACPR